jgi:Fur family peroxide stress response transcriptional regulator
MNVTEATIYLENKGIKTTYQRAVIFSYLNNKKNHPTADMMLNDLGKKVPTLSRATIYNTMEFFREKGVVQVLNMDDGLRHYDADLSTHLHFHCNKCDTIYDMYTQLDTDKIDELKDFEVHNQFININGICKNCKKKEK